MLLQNSLFSEYMKADFPQHLSHTGISQGSVHLLSSLLMIHTVAADRKQGHKLGFHILELPYTTLATK
jgi:hypothetical protein